MRATIEAALKGAANADAAVLNQLERHIIRAKAEQARKTARSECELFDLMLEFAIRDATHVGAVVDARVQRIAREFLGAVH